MQDFQKLKVWEKSHRVAIDVYRLSERFPNRAGLALTTQLRRAAFSVPANIAEGAGKTAPAEFKRFLDIALGSAAETHYHLMIARDIGLLDNERYDDLSRRVTDVRRMLTGLLKRVKAAADARTSLTAPSPRAEPSSSHDDGRSGALLPDHE